MCLRVRIATVALALIAAELIASNLLFATAGRSTLTGKIVDAAGKPVEHATVMVYYAGVKQGYSTFCPSCYVDCGKRAFTGADGAFTISGLDWIPPTDL